MLEQLTSANGSPIAHHQHRSVSWVNNTWDPWWFDIWYQQQSAFDPWVLNADPRPNISTCVQAVQTNKIFAGPTETNWPKAACFIFKRNTEGKGQKLWLSPIYLLFWCEPWNTKAAIHRHKPTQPVWWWTIICLDDEPSFWLFLIPRKFHCFTASVATSDFDVAFLCLSYVANVLAQVLTNGSHAATMAQEARADLCRYCRSLSNRSSGSGSLHGWFPGFMHFGSSRSRMTPNPMAYSKRFKTSFRN